MKSNDVKVGQIYLVTKDDNTLEKYVVTYIDEYSCCYVIDREGLCGACYSEALTKYGKLLAEYPSWTQSVNSSEFNDKRILN